MMRAIFSGRRDTNRREHRATFRNPSEWLLDAFGGGKTSSGEQVTQSTALQISAAWSCVRALSEGVSSLPLHVYKRLPDGGRQRLREHPLDALLSAAPNPEMSAMVFRETLQAHLATWGNAYALIVRANNGRVSRLWPVRPDSVRVRRGAEKQIVYDISDEPQGHNFTTYPAVDVLHIPGLSFDGLVGYSPIRLARETLGLSVAAEKYGASLFGNSAKPAVLLEHPGVMNEQEFDHFKRSWDQVHQGASNANKTVILEQGMKVAKLSFSAEEAQFLGSRRFTIEEICRWFNVPPALIHDHSRSTFSNNEQQSLNFVTYSLTPWLVRWEQELNRKLLMPAERPALFAKHSVQGLLRGDSAARSAFWRTMSDLGAVNVNEIREFEELNPVAGGDLHLVQVNRTRLDALGEIGGGDADDGDRSDPRPTEPAQTAQTARAFKPLVEEALGRVLKVEADKCVRSRRRSPGAFAGWRDAFYAEQHIHVTAALATIFDALADAAGVPAADLTPTLEQFARRHCEQSLLDLSEGDVTQAALRWTSDRAADDAEVAILEITNAI